MAKIGAWIVISLCVLGQAGIGHSQSMPRNQGPLADVPSNDVAYADVEQLRDAGLTVYGFNSGGSRRPSTVREFSVAIVGVLNDKANATFNDTALRAHPAALAALDRLYFRFEPTISTIGVDVAATRSHLDALGRPFPDVPREHWAYGSVEALRRLGIVVGYPERSFQANR